MYLQNITVHHVKVLYSLEVEKRSVDPIAGYAAL